MPVYWVVKIGFNPFVTILVDLKRNWGRLDGSWKEIPLVHGQSLPTLPSCPGALDLTYMYMPIWNYFRLRFKIAGHMLHRFQSPQFIQIHQPRVLFTDRPAPQLGFEWPIAPIQFLLCSATLHFAQIKPRTETTMGDSLCVCCCDIWNETFLAELFEWSFRVCFWDSTQNCKQRITKIKQLMYNVLLETCSRHFWAGRGFFGKS